MPKFKGWTRPGPIPPGGVAPEEGETLDGLVGHWKIFQYAKGHRFSVDDLLGAWYGTVWCPRAARIADLGSGLGTLAMVAAWRCPGAVVHTVEAQDISLHLARKSLAYNGAADQVFPRLGDLRDPGLFEGEAPFDLVMGSPPYWSTADRKPADHPQAIPARLEVRGGVEDYARAARPLLAPGGIFALVFPNDQRERVAKALAEAGLLALRRREVVFKEGQAYGLDLWISAQPEDFPEDFATRTACPEVEAPITIRRADGSVHPSIALVRIGLGFPPGL